MRLWHTHTWVEYARTYSQPRAAAIEAPSPAEERMIHGCTTILLRCTDQACGELRTITLLGKVVDGDIAMLERMARG